MTYLPLPLAPYVHVDDFNAGMLLNYPILKRKKRDRAVEKLDIIDVTCAFDIETTALPEIEQSVLYIWQFQIGTDLTVFGRTWDDFKLLQEKIMAVLPGHTQIVVFVHNLSYEFEFLAGIYDFKIEEVFAPERRKVLYCTMHERRFEFRCSYRLSNMNLKDFTRKFHVKHEKLTDFDYGIPRYWFSPLTIEELRYCQNDVLGLVEAVNMLLITERYNLLNMPLTSTGFIRKDLKKIVTENLGYRYAQKFFPGPELFRIMRRAFRGGDVHCNRYYINDILHDVSSADRSSSYPDVLVNGFFRSSRSRRLRKQILTWWRNLFSSAGGRFCWSAALREYD